MQYACIRYLQLPFTHVYTTPLRVIVIMSRKHTCITCKLMPVAERHTRCDDCAKHFRNPAHFFENTTIDFFRRDERLQLFAYYDETVPCSEERTRPDWVWVMPDRAVICECDENEHRYNSAECKTKRLQDMVDWAGGNDKRLAVVRFNPTPRNQTVGQVLERLRTELYRWFDAPIVDFNAPDGVNISYLGYSRKRQRQLESAAAAAQGAEVSRYGKLHAMRALLAKDPTNEHLRDLVAELQGALAANSSTQRHKTSVGENAVFLPMNSLRASDLMSCDLSAGDAAFFMDNYVYIEDTGVMFDVWRKIDVPLGRFRRSHAMRVCSHTLADGTCVDVPAALVWSYKVPESNVFSGTIRDSLGPRAVAHPNPALKPLFNQSYRQSDAIDNINKERGKNHHQCKSADDKNIEILALVRKNLHDKETVNQWKRPGQVVTVGKAELLAGIYFHFEKDLKELYPDRVLQMLKATGEVIYTRKTLNNEKHNGYFGWKTSTPIPLDDLFEKYATEEQKRARRSTEEAIAM